MGVVYEAVESGLERRVALKVVSPQYAGSAELRARFATEARAQAALDSPHVVPVHAHGEVEGTPYLASRLIAGGDLGDLLRTRGAPPPGVAVDLVAQVASGLATAHEHGVVHRDLKPANVLLHTGADGTTAYLTDFGIARVAGLDHGLTTQGFAVGTPSHQAPELHTGADAGPRSDVYSLGCLLWAALTGAPPYAGRTDYQLAQAHLRAPVPQVTGTGDFERTLNRVLRTALAKDPSARYPSAVQLRDDLRSLRRYDAPAYVVRAGSPRRRRTGRVIGAVAGAAGVAAAAVLVAQSLGGAGDGGLTGAEQEAAAELAAVLVTDGGVTEEQADCTARAFVAATGTEALVGAGMLDADLRYVEGSRTRDRELLEALTAATLDCVER
jgi:serine/threonine protein kinase